MTRRPTLFVVLTCSLSLGACAHEAPKPTRSPAQALEQLDGRSPVPLLPRMANHQKKNMREHLEAVQAIVTALVTDDFAAIEQAAGRMGFSEQMGKMCTNMGAAAPGFTPQALAFHHQADRIGDAARAHDRARVLTELSTTLQACTACHAVWQQQVVDEAGWRAATLAEPPAHALQQ
jgi:cytochrome c556